MGPWLQDSGREAARSLPTDDGSVESGAVEGCQHHSSSGGNAGTWAGGPPWIRWARNDTIRLVDTPAVANFRSAPGTRRLAWPIAAVAVAGSAVAIIVEAATSPESDLLVQLMAALGAVAFAVIGALVAS